MKALSIRQPWATLILHGQKDIENRSWATRQRGQVLIHTSKGMTRDEWEDAMIFAGPMLREIYTLDAAFDELFSFESQSRGGIVGVMNIVDCVSSSASPWFMGDFGFVLADVRSLPFTPLKGSLGFFDVPDGLINGLQAAKACRGFFARDRAGDKEKMRESSATGMPIKADLQSWPKRLKK